MWDRLLVDCRIATMEPMPGNPLGIVEHGAIGIQDGRIVRVGKRAELAGFRIPVWGAFLLIYPPLCLALFAVTYLAFRWRWWRASNSQ